MNTTPLFAAFLAAPGRRLNSVLDMVELGMASLLLLSLCARHFSQSRPDHTH
jgi:hypothetical protein